MPSDSSLVATAFKEPELLVQCPRDFREDEDVRADVITRSAGLDIILAGGSGNLFDSIGESSTMVVTADQRPIERRTPGIDGHRLNDPQRHTAQGHDPFG